MGTVRDTINLVVVDASVETKYDCCVTLQFSNAYMEETLHIDFTDKVSPGIDVNAVDLNKKQVDNLINELLELRKLFT
jgi:hypothetical protein